VQPVGVEVELGRLRGRHEHPVGQDAHRLPAQGDKRAGSKLYIESRRRPDLPFGAWHHGRHRHHRAGPGQRDQTGGDPAGPRGLRTQVSNWLCAVKITHVQNPQPAHRPKSSQFRRVPPLALASGLLSLTLPAMKALVLTSSDGTVEYADVEDPALRAGTALVKLKAAGLNRRDYWITQGLYPGMSAPCIMGSDGAGVVTAVGEGVEESWIGKEVIIYPGRGWGPSPEAQSDDFRILGMPDDGVFAEQIVVPVEQLVAKPEHLTIHEAAALPIAGLTAYRALFSQGKLQPHETILITGIGGGVAVMALKLAAASGARVLVSSSSPEKIERAIALGATAGANYKEEGWASKLNDAHGPIDLAIDGAAGAGFNDLLGLVRPGGRIVSYGGTAGPPEQYDIRRHFWRQIHVIGSTFGSPDDLAGLMSQIERHGIKPEIDSVAPLSEGANVVASMADSPQFGKLVLEIA